MEADKRGIIPLIMKIINGTVPLLLSAKIVPLSHFFRIALICSVRLRAGIKADGLPFLIQVPNVLQESPVFLDHCGRPLKAHLAAETGQPAVKIPARSYFQLEQRIPSPLPRLHLDQVSAKLSQDAPDSAVLPLSARSLPCPGETPASLYKPLPLFDTYAP